jgi:hypothetical protein
MAVSFPSIGLKLSPLRPFPDAADRQQAGQRSDYPGLISALIRETEREIAVSFAGRGDIAALQAAYERR